MIYLPHVLCAGGCIYLLCALIFVRVSHCDISTVNVAATSGGLLLLLGVLLTPFYMLA